MDILVNYGYINWYWNLWWDSPLGQRYSQYHMPSRAFERHCADTSFSTEMVWNSLTLYLLSSSHLFSQQNSLKGQSSFLVVCGVRANFSGDILDKQYLKWIENHKFTYCSIYGKCKTVTKTSDHDPRSSMFITHITMEQILSWARFGNFHCPIVLLLQERPELLQLYVLMLYLHRKMYVEF